MLFESLSLKLRTAKVLASIVCSVFLGTLTASASFADPGWVLTQRSTKMGDQYVYISDQGMKISNPKVGFNLVTRAPNWDITMFNDKTRCFYETTADHYRAQISGRGSNDADFKNSTWAKSGETNIGGLKATEYRMGGKTVHAKNKQGAVVVKSIAGAQYWVAADINIPPKLTELLAAAYGLPAQTSSCVPLRLKYSESNGDHTVLDTYRVDKTPIPIAYFERPANYKLVQSDAEVMMNDDQKQIMNDMAKSLETDPQGAQLGAKLQKVRSGGATPGQTFTKDDVSKLLDIFGKKKQ